MTFGLLGRRHSGRKVTFWKDITRKEVTENREKGDFRGSSNPEKGDFAPGKTWLYDLRELKPSNYPEKGDLGIW